MKSKTQTPKKATVSRAAVNRIESHRSKIVNTTMYRKPKFLQILHRIREKMSREVDYDVDLFVEMIRSGTLPAHGPAQNIRGFRRHAPPASADEIPSRRAPRKRAAR